MFNRKAREIEKLAGMLDEALEGYATALSQRDYFLKQLQALQGELQKMIEDPCKPVTWPANDVYVCQYEHRHDGKRAIGGDFPV